MEMHLFFSKPWILTEDLELTYPIILLLMLLLLVIYFEQNGLFYMQETQ